MKPGTRVQFDASNGSFGYVEGDAGGDAVFVRWCYGLDVQGKALTARARVRTIELRVLAVELHDAFDRYVKASAWSSEQAIIRRELER